MIFMIQKEEYYGRNLAEMMIFNISFIRLALTMKINGFVQNVFGALFHTVRCEEYYVVMLYCRAWDEHSEQSSKQFNFCLTLASQQSDRLLANYDITGPMKNESLTCEDNAVCKH